MKMIQTIMEKSKIESIISYLLFDDMPKEKIDNYEDKITESYQEFFDGLEKMFLEASRDNDDLFEMVADFAALHDEIFLTIGITIGYNLNKELETTWNRIRPNEEFKQKKE